MGDRHFLISRRSGTGSAGGRGPPALRSALPVRNQIGGRVQWLGACSVESDNGELRGAVVPGRGLRARIVEVGPGLAPAVSVDWTVPGLSEDHGPGRLPRVPFQGHSPVPGRSRRRSERGSPAPLVVSALDRVHRHSVPDGRGQ